ncbi:MAG: TIGR02678 family protein [Proteobacteria bacterium]|nr:TIGR02678 family protein [Pseudomonadota bacterium]
MATPSESQRIVQQQRLQQQDELRQAKRALLMTPLMGAAHPALPLVRRHAEALREWFQREAGWPLVVERDGARLYKHPADLASATRGLPRYDRQRYVLLCLACAVLERAEAQISLRSLGERLLGHAAEPTLAARGFAFTLQTQGERRALVTVCQTLLDLGVLQRVAGDEDAYVQGLAQQQGDVLYDVNRRSLAGLLAAVRGPSSWPVGQAPVSLEERLASLVQQVLPDHDEARRGALRHALARRLLDDPVLYLHDLDEPARAYFVNQRGAMAARLAEGTGLVAEHRAEGSALTDDAAELSDVLLPAEGTEAHATLLVAEYLANALSERQCAALPVAAVAAFLAAARETHGRFWRKAARESGGEHELAAQALQRLARLGLLRLQGDAVLPLPAVARYRLGGVQTLDAPA